MSGVGVFLCGCVVFLFFMLRLSSRLVYLSEFAFFVCGLALPESVWYGMIRLEDCRYFFSQWSCSFY